MPSSCQSHVKWFQGFRAKQLSISCKVVSGLQCQAVVNRMQNGFRASEPSSCQSHVKWFQGFRDKQLSLGCKVVSKLQQQAVVNCKVVSGSCQSDAVVMVSVK